MKVIAIIIVVALVMFTVINTLKTKSYQTLVSYLETGDYDLFNQKINQPFIQFLFPKSSLLDLKFNAALIQQNKKEATQYLEALCAMSLTVSQKENYYMKAFNFFIGIKDKKNSKKYLDFINEGSNDRMKLEANRVYNIYILKNDKDLEDLLDEIENMEDQEKGVNEFLISIIYKNKKDKVNAKKYEDLSKEHFALVDEKTAQKIR